MQISFEINRFTYDFNCLLEYVHEYEFYYNLVNFVIFLYYLKSFLSNT